MEGCMSMKPILFNTEMVRAILDGRKTVTRRVVKPQPGEELAYIWGGSNHGKWSFSPYNESRYEEHRAANDWKYWTPPYRSGDILYVRETWSTKRSNDCLAQPCNTGTCQYESCETAEGPCFPDEYIYKATDSLPPYGGRKWRPSIHMPREAARIWLRVTDVRVERLQEIDEDGSIAEGCSAGRFETTGGPWGVEDDPDEWTAREDFSHVWDSTVRNTDRDCYGWAANPWVWVIEFERCEKPEEG